MKYFLCLILFFSPFIVLSKTVVTYAGEGGGPRYLKTLLELALEKTKSEFGAFELVSTNRNENYPRLLRQLDRGVYENFVMKVSVTDEILNKYNVISFPLDRGVTGYRVAFSSLKNGQKKCENINLNNIEAQITVQGIGWLDTDILKYNRFNVYAISRAQQMFEMIEFNRATFFLEVLMSSPMKQVNTQTFL